MSALGIFAIAFDSHRHRYDSWHNPPEVDKYIEAVSPDTLPHEYVDGGKFFKVDTTRITKAGGHVTASEDVLVGGERRPFSYWLIKPNPMDRAMVITDRTLEIFRGEYGIVGLYFGVQRKPILWPGFDVKDFDLFVHVMMSHAGSWEPPHPQPWGSLIKAK